MDSQAQRGLSLIELMVAMTAGLIVIAIAGNVLLGTLRSSAVNLRYIRLNQDLRVVLGAIVADVSRAGGWALAAALVEATTTTDLLLSGRNGTVTATALARGTQTPNGAFAVPFSDAALRSRTLIAGMPGGVLVELQIDARRDRDTLFVTVPTGITLSTTTLPAGSWTVLNPFADIDVADGCIVFSYDLDEDGVRDDDERFGYRYDASQKVIEASSGSDSCRSGSWQDITDPQVVEISAFGVAETRTEVDATALTGLMRHYRLQLSGRLVADRAAVRTVQSVAEVRNLAFE